MHLVGVLELQGDFAEHTSMLQRCGAQTKPVRLPQDLSGIDALVIPGGESTTIGKLLEDLEMMSPLKKMVSAGLPVFGTCAGCILLARDIEGYPSQPRLGAIDISVERNSYGRQINSFETYVKADSDLFHNSPLRAVLIRAPAVTRVGSNVEILAQLDDKPIIVREGNCMATTFHPELTTDLRVHKLFLEIVACSRLTKGAAAMTLQN